MSTTPTKRLDHHRRDIGPCELERIITDGNEMETTETIVKKPTPTEADKRATEKVLRKFSPMKPRKEWEESLTAASQLIAAIEKVEG